MGSSKPIINTGLRGVTVASTRISHVDGTAGRLIYRGYLIRELAEKKATFEEIVFLLLHEYLPGKEELASFKALLRKERAIPDALVAALKALPKESLPMDILQAAVSILADFDPDLTVATRDASLGKAVRLIARLPTVMAAWDRIRNGNEPVAPHESLDHGANFLYMLSGNLPDEDVAEFLDMALMLHAEHSFNASTFSARQVASTRAHIYAAVGAAIGSLSGDLHGGANVRVMEMLMDIGSVDKIESYVRTILEEGRKIMGLGHAVYKVDDPRALILAPMSKVTGERIGQPQWYEMSKKLEVIGKEEFKRHKGIDIFVNVDFYSASLYHSMGIAVDLFTPVFAISRVAGWTAHVIEEQFADAAPKPMLYRPGADYVGEYCGPDVCEFIPLDDR